MATPTPRAFYADLQPDWHLQPRESCWLNVRERTLRFCGGDAPRVDVESRVNATFGLPLADAATASHGKDNAAHLVQVTQRGSDWVQVRAASADDADLLRVVFQAPRESLDVFAPVPASLPDEFREIEPITSHRVVRPQLLSVDVSSDEQFVVAGGADGKCSLWNLGENKTARPLEGHMLDVTRAAFFPSSKVVLTGSLDFTLRIWSVENGRCAAVLKGHRGGVTDLAVVGRGRNVISSASDGAVHLWCCGNQEIVAAWNNEDKSPAQCLTLLDDTNASLATLPSGDESGGVNEFETEGRILFTGLENGKVLGIDVRARDLALDLVCTASVLSCAATSSSGIPMLVTGGEDGTLMTWDLRHSSSPVHAVSRSTGAIHRIVIPGDDRGSVWTAQGDGTCSNWSNLLQHAKGPPLVSLELTGPEYDPVRDLAVSSSTHRVFSACRDGLVREYIPRFTA